MSEEPVPRRTPCGKRKKVILGGSECAVGPAPSLMRRIVSESVRCTKCAQKVARFAGYRWTGEASYMHFRNYYPDPDKLLVQAVKSQTAAAYCCQCNWTSLEGINEVNGGLPWVAG